MKQTLPVSSIETNNGQIPGLPRNPRLIRDGSFEKLKRSIKDFPEMLELREIVVFPHAEKFVTIGGNMRLIACKDLGFTEIPTKVLPADFPIEKLAEFAIKDNVEFGEDDIELLANEWPVELLEEWGMELPDMSEFAPNLDPETSQRVVSVEDIVKTKAELDAHYKDSADKYVEVICPHCAETFYLKQD